MNGPRGTWLALGMITATGLILRLFSLDLTHYNIDEAIASALATQIAHGRTFPLVGIRTSFGFHNPPLFLYLLAPFFAVSRDPRLAAGFLAVLGAAVPLILWRATRRAGGTKTAALMAAMLAAVCPNAVEYCRRLWGHDTIVFLGSLSLLLAVEGWRHRDWRFAGGALAAAAAAQAMHLSGALLWLPALVLAAASGRAVFIRSMALGIGVLACLYAPWVLNEIREGYPDARLVLAQVTGGAVARDLGLAVEPVAAWALILGDSWSNDLLGNTRPWMVSAVAGIAGFILSATALLLSGGGLCRAVLQVLRRTEERVVAVALLTGILGPALVFALLFRASVPPYFLPALPCGVVAAALFLGENAGDSRSKTAHAILLFFGVAAIVMQMAVNVGIRGGGSSRATLREKMMVVEEIARQSGAEGTPYVFQNGRAAAGGIDVAFVYLLYWRDLSHRIPADPRNATEAFVIVEDHAILRPEPMAFLRPRGIGSSNHLLLYRLRGPEINDWMVLLDRHPAPRQE